MKGSWEMGPTVDTSAAGSAIGASLFIRPSSRAGALQDASRCSGTGPVLTLDTNALGDGQRPACVEERHRRSIVAQLHQSNQAPFRRGLFRRPIPGQPRPAFTGFLPFALVAGANPTAGCALTRYCRALS